MSLSFLEDMRSEPACILSVHSVRAEGQGGEGWQNGFGK